MFPEELTQFTNKRNAQYQGDPQGDYILAEHINEVQNAITRIEKSMGITARPGESLTERINQLENLRSLRVPSIGYFTSGYGSDATYLESVFSHYPLLILGERATILQSVIPKLRKKGIRIYGRVSGSESLSLIQTAIGQWKSLGVGGIYLDGLNEDGSQTRTEEQRILSSIKQENLALFLHSARWKALLEKNAQSPYNPSGVALEFPSQRLLQLNNFAYHDRLYPTTELLAGTLPNVRLLKESGFSIAGFSKTNSQESYQYAMGAGLLFGIDYLHNGEATGYSLQNEPPTFEWTGGLADWQTDNPLVFQDGNRLYRNFPEGKIIISDDLSVELVGNQTASSLIHWLAGTIPGDSLEDGSVDPIKLSSYDIRRIVDLLNQSEDPSIKIDPTKIDMDEGGIGLPINIPPSNMVQNVIEAINRKNNTNTTEKDYIEDFAIKSLSATKLTGSITKDQMKVHVIEAINEMSDELNFIQVPRLEAVNLTSTGTANLNTLTADNMTLRAGNVTESWNMADAVSSGYFTGNEGEFYKLYVQELTVDKLLGLKDLHVENLTADNIGTLVLEAIEANIENGIFQTIVTKSLEADEIKADLVTALNAVIGSQITNEALFGTAVITDAAIKTLSADKLSAGTIDTTRISLTSESGHLKMIDNKLQVYDSLDTENNRRLRVLLGDINEITQGDNDYGLVVLGPDGSTRLYDHTGVYNAGIHQNAISNDKIEDDAIDGRVIRAGAIIGKHIMGETITGDLIAADSILTNHILADSITGDKLMADTISAREISAGAVRAGHILSGVIDSSHIRAGSITADRLAIGFTVNLVKDGYDSFEQEPVGELKSIVLAGSTHGEITRDWAFDGNKSLLMVGNSVSSRIRLARDLLDYTIPVMPGHTYCLSSYVRTQSTNNVPVTLGIAYNNNTVEYSPILTVTRSERVKRLSHSFTVPEGVLRLSIIIGVEATNVGVYFDCLQVEELEEDKFEPGPWRSVSATKIDGASIETGYIDASHIHIGNGTVFGSSNEIIDITDEGIKAKSVNGYAMLNSKGLEITGGAFSLKSSNVSGTNTTIDGVSGITVANPLNEVHLNATSGLRIINKAQDYVALDLDPQTGKLRMAGTFEIFDKDNPEMKWSLWDKVADMDEINDQLEQTLDSLKDITIPALENNILTRAEKSAIQASFNTLRSEKIEVDAVFLSLKDNPYLLSKTKLESQKTSYNASYDSLFTAINAVLQYPNDTLIPPNLITAVNTGFDNYGTALAALRSVFQESEQLINKTMQEETKTAIGSELEHYATSEQLEAIQNQVDGAIETWFDTGEPTLQNTPAKDWTTNELKDQHLGDLYFDEYSGYAYRFVLNGTVYQWTRVTDNDVTLALAQAREALDLADKKRRVFVVTPRPPYDIGDMWFDSFGDLLRATVPRTENQNYQASDWQKATKYTDDSAVENLEIGGRNLVIDSYNQNRFNIYTTTGIRTMIDDSLSPTGKVLKISLNGPHSGNNALYISLKNMTGEKLLKGKMYTFSFLARASESVKIESNGVNQMNVIEQTKASVTTEYSRWWATLSPTVDSTDASNYNMHINVKPLSSNSVDLYIMPLMFESGTKPSDWSPAPEDIEAKFEETNLTINNLRETMNNARDVRLGMKLDYSTFTTAATNFVYLCGTVIDKDSLQEKLADIDGSIYDRATQVTYPIPKQGVNLTGVTAGTSGYLVWDNTSKQIWFIHYVKTMSTNGISSERWNKRNIGKTGDNTTIVLTDSIFVIGELEF